MPEAKDPSRVIAGLKAAISNPNVSEDAKETVHRRLRGYENGNHGEGERVSERHSSEVTDEGGHDDGWHKSCLRKTSIEGHQMKLRKSPERALKNSPEKHVAFADEEEAQEVLAEYKATMEDPAVPRGDRENAKVHLSYHDELEGVER